MLPEYKIIYRDVSEDFVKGFFQNIKLSEDFSTTPDSMGCYSKYEIEVSKLEAST